MTKAEEIIKIIQAEMDKHPELGVNTGILYCPDKLNNKTAIGIMEYTTDEGSDKGLRKRFTITVDDHLYDTEK